MTFESESMMVVFYVMVVTNAFIWAYAAFYLILFIFFGRNRRPEMPNVLTATASVIDGQTNNGVDCKEHHVYIVDQGKSFHVQFSDKHSHIKFGSGGWVIRNGKNREVMRFSDERVARFWLISAVITHGSLTLEYEEEASRDD